MGTFDASGAFLPLKVSTYEEIRGRILLEVGGNCPDGVLLFLPVYPLPPHLPLYPLIPCRRAPRSPFLRSKSLTSRAWKKKRKSLLKGWMRRHLRQVSLQGWGKEKA